jgi:hypothetical protein
VRDKWKYDECDITDGNDDIVLEKEIFSADNETNVSDYRYMEREYSEKNIKMAQVIDAEGSYVCIAPEPIARLIAKLLNELGNK